MNIFADTWRYLTDPANWQGDGGIWARLLEQLLLTGTALALAMVVGLPIALWLGHLGRGGFLAINISNVGRAIPTFALLALLVIADWPGTAGFGPYGRAGLATLIALMLFALPPIVTQSYVAVREVPGEVKESARGMGMTGRQQFFRIELPLALPLVVSGLRLALVQVWATATIAALVAGPGLAGSSPTGSTGPTTPRASPARSWSPSARWSSSWPPPPCNGWSTRSGPRPVGGSRCRWRGIGWRRPIPADRTPDTRGPTRGTQKVTHHARTTIDRCTRLSRLALHGHGLCRRRPRGPRGHSRDLRGRWRRGLDLGSGFPEAELVAAMYAQLLEDAGYTVEVNLVDTRDVYMQQFPGQIDVVPEYVGGIVDFLNVTGTAPTPRR